MATKASRSTLLNHGFPPFYACYLLKSIRTPKSTATYVGSTPSPPRRIRQHNGEIAQGAWKTQSNRPWVMQLIVHGFPSKLAALQFEWAWQHPWKSRHLRDEDGKALFSRSSKLNHLKRRVEVAHGMVRSYPYTTWPLHVKLFTDEAAKVWNDLSRKAPLPPGFSHSVELEGVDGKSGKTGSGRIGPIDVTDLHFTTSHIQKAQTLCATHLSHQCSICKDPIADFPSNALDTALCPTTTCTALYHLSCLAKSFSSSSTSSNTLIPRGGHCPSCNTYILWGDVVRGCYRLHKGVAGVLETQDADDALEDEEMREEATDEDMDVDGDDEADAVAIPARKRKSKGKGKETAVAKPIKEKKKAVEPSSPSKPRKRRTKAQEVPAGEEEEGEFFDLSNISSSSSESPPPRPSAPKRAARASKLSSPPRKTSRSRSPKRVNMPSPPEIDFFDIKSDEGLSDALSSLSISSPSLSELEDQILQWKKPVSPTGTGKKGRGRPKKAIYVEISD